MAKRSTHVTDKKQTAIDKATVVIAFATAIYAIVAALSFLIDHKLITLRENNAVEMGGLFVVTLFLLFSIVVLMAYVWKNRRFLS